MRRSTTCFALTILSILAVACMSGCHSPAGSITSEPWGSHDGRPVHLFTLVNAAGARCRITTYGATVTHLEVPDREGRLADVVLGFDRLEDYVAHSPYFGCIVGRCANRIARGRFTLDGKEYRLAVNNGPNHLHGGLRGFDKRVWEVEDASVTERGPALTLSYVSADGEEGYPGKLEVRVTFTWTDEPGLRIDMEARTDAPTLCNLTHHGYWNLAGHDAGTILDHELRIEADLYTPADGTLIPTGRLAGVAGTPYDFRRRKRIGRDIDRLQAERDAGHGGGYDVNFVVRGAASLPAPVALVVEPRSGRVLRVLSDQPGVQLYTGNFLDGSIRGKGGAVYRKYQAFCLETQKFPDAVHHENFPSVVLRPGEVYRHHVAYLFR